MVYEIYFKVIVGFILSFLFKNKFNLYDWFKILELRKVIVKVFNEIFEFRLVVIFDMIFVKIYFLF